MLTLARYLEVMTLGVWLGGMVVFSFIVAPALFQVLGSRQVAGEVVTMVLNRLYALSYICGALYLLGVLLEQYGRGGIGHGLSGVPTGVWLEVGLVAVLLLATFYSHYFLAQRMAGLREQMKSLFGSIDQTAHEHPLRVAFNRYHRVSVGLLSGTLAGVLVLLGLLLRRWR
ncbi:MAG: DUF4149 domain-containing protein [Terriglobia bacterium]